MPVLPTALIERAGLAEQDCMLSAVSFISVFADTLLAGQRWVSILLATYGAAQVAASRKLSASK